MMCLSMSSTMTLQTYLCWYSKENSDLEALYKTRSLPSILKLWSKIILEYSMSLWISKVCPGMVGNVSIRRRIPKRKLEIHVYWRLEWYQLEFDALFLQSLLRRSVSERLISPNRDLSL